MTYIEAMKQALEALENAQHFIDEYAAAKYIHAHNAAVTSLRQAIATEESLCISDAAATQEPVAYMRMPKVGDRVVCIEDEDFGTVQSLTAGGSPDIKFDDGSYGTYLLREFAELFRYADTHSQPKAEGEHALEQALTRLQKRYSELESKVAAQPKAKQSAPAISEGYKLVPAEATIEMLAAAANECGISGQRVYRVMLAAAPAQPKAEQEPKREWVGLTDDEIMDMYNEPRSDAEMITFGREVEAKLKEKNT